MTPVRNAPQDIVLPLAVVAGGLVIGVGLVKNPDVVLPLTVEALALSLVTAFAVRLEKDHRIRRNMVRLVLAALALRGLALFVVHGALSPNYFAPDAIGYARLGDQMADYWRGVGPFPLRERFQTYPYLNGIFAYTLGNSTMASVVLNSFAGTWTCIVTFYLGRRLLSEEVGWIAGGLVAAFPSMVLWSVLNIRDPLTTLAVVAAALSAVLMIQKRSRTAFFSFAFLAFLLWSLRDYMAFLVVSGTALGAFASARPGRVGRSLVVGVIFVVGAVYLAEQAGILVKVQEGEALNTAQIIRRGMGVGAGSSFGTSLDTSTLGGALRYLPVGMVIILLAPFPWAITSTLQLFSLPEVITWYLLFPFMFPGIRLAMREGDRLHLIALTVLLVVVVTYALVEGNVGTAYRHRAQVMPLAFLYVATGLVYMRAQLWGARAKRRKSAGRDQRGDAVAETGRRRDDRPHRTGRP